MPSLQHNRVHKGLKAIATALTNNSGGLYWLIFEAARLREVTLVMLPDLVQAVFMNIPVKIEMRLRQAMKI